MMSVSIIRLFNRFKNLVILVFLILLFFNSSAFAQEPPPRPVQVTVTENLVFGAFTQGALGGTVIINSTGGRSATGDVILLFLGYPFNTATYRLVANVGTVISLLNGPDATLSNGTGGIMTLKIGSSNPVWPFVITTVPPAYTDLYVGGTLTVNSPAITTSGSYSGTFDITFVQE